MFFKAIEFGRVVQNVVLFDDRNASNLSGFDKFEKITGKSVGELRRKLEKKNVQRKLQSLSLLVLVLPLSACGGSDSAGEAVEVPITSGRAIDGYLGEASVLQAATLVAQNFAAVINAQQEFEAAISAGSTADTLSGTNGFNFASTSTAAGEEGNFEITGIGAIYVFGGVDMATGKPFNGSLSAPEGAQTVTPVTTLVEKAVAAAEAGGETNIDVAAISGQIARGLGLNQDADILNTDFVATSSAGLAKAAAQVASVMTIVSSAGGSTAEAAVLSKLADKIAAAGEVGGKSKALTDTAEMKAVFDAVQAETPEAFAAVPDTVNLDAVLSQAATTVQATNAKIAAATSLKDIVEVQSAVQGSISESFAAIQAGTSDVAALEAANADIDAILDTAAADLATYLSTAELGFEVAEDALDISDVDATIVEIAADIVDAIADGTLDEDTVQGILDGTIDQDDVVIPGVDAAEPDAAEPDAGGETEEDSPAAGGGGGGGSSPTTYNLTASDNIQSTINSASDGDIIVLASGRYDQSFTVSKDVDIRGANYGKAISADGSDGDSKVDEISEVAFDISDNQRTGGTNETWINGTVTVASDGVTLDGLRLHAYNGPLDFSGTDIDNFSLQNSYVTGFEGSQSLRYIDTDGTASTGWNIDGNLIGGVAGGVGGSMYLTGVATSTIEDNVFWRPGAAHLYLEDVSSVDIKDNFFVQGLHADGANSDGLLDDLTATSSWGYIGFSGGEGYGSVGGYGYGFGYGYDGSVETTSMGYGYGSEGGYGPTGYIPSGYGITSDAGGGTSYTYHGRNYVAEVKGDASNVTFTGNTAKFNSGGIQFWDEGDTDNVFSDIIISNNTFTDFLNADPDGLLAAVTSRHKSGLMGGVTFSVADGSTSADLDITGNTFTGAVNQIFNNNDIDSLILVQGEIDDVNISTNTLTWTGSPNSETNVTAVGGDTGSSRSIYDIYTQGIHLAGDVNADAATFIALQNNIFETSTAARYISDAILIDGTNYTSSGLGTLSSDVYIVSEDSDHAASGSYLADVDDFGTYNEPSSSDNTLYEAITALGGYLDSGSFTILTEATTSSSEIIYSNDAIIS